MHIHKSIIVSIFIIIVMSVSLSYGKESVKGKKYYQDLGDSLKRAGKLEEALQAYEKAKALDGKDDELIKDIATVQKWLRRYRESEASLKEVLTLDPHDREARDDLRSLQLRRGIKIWGWFGGYEPDYTTKSYETMIFYGGLDSMDIYGGYGYSDQVYYTRNKIYGKAYYFYNPRSYLKGGFYFKNYNYPADSTGKPNPDSNSYDKVPSIELEVSHMFPEDIRGTLTYEFFTPSFFYDKDTRANNYKIGGELEFLFPIRGLKGTLVYAMLHDPDPDRTRIKGRGTPPASATSITYRNTSLFGGSVKYTHEPWEIKFKYFPNRDLDNSYAYSFFTTIGYEFNNRLRGRFDHVFDKYSSQSNFSGKTANVVLLSAFYKLMPYMEIGGGYKYIDIPRGIENRIFISILYKTGIWL